MTKLISVVIKVAVYGKRLVEALVVVSLSGQPHGNGSVVGAGRMHTVEYRL